MSSNFINVNANSSEDLLGNAEPIDPENDNNDNEVENGSINNKKEQTVKFTENRKNSKKKKNILRHRKRISHLVKQSNEIQKSFKPGAFEEVLNGPRGPDVRLHRHNIIVGLLKLFLILFLTAGIVLLSVIMLCITINVGYVCVQIDSVNSVIQLLFFAFYFDAIYYITRSFWRTYLRSLHTILEAHFGSSFYDIFIKRVLGYFLSLKIAKWTLPESYESHPRDWYERINLTVFVIFLFILALPILLIAIFYGYWKVVGMVCLLFVCGGAVTIVFLNVYSRFLLFTKFFRRLDEFYYNAPFFVDVKERIDNQTSYLRLTYCTTNGLKGGKKPVDYVLDLLIHMVITIGIAAFIFGSFDPDVWKISAVIILLVILLPIRYRKYLKKFLVKLHILSRAKMEKKDESIKNKVNAEMDAVHKKFVDNKKITEEANKTSTPATPVIENIAARSASTSHKTGWDLLKNMKSNGNTSQIVINEPDSIQINVEPVDGEGSHSVNDHDINEINNDMQRINSNNHLSVPEVGVNSPRSIDSSFVVVNNNENPSSSAQNVYVNTERITSNTSTPLTTPISSPLSIPVSTPRTTTSVISSTNIKINADDEDSFYYLLQSDKAYIRRKTLLTWDISSLISWRGCVTVFVSRCVKFILGVAFMAILNYYRYSVKTDESTTNNYLLKDTITHIVFLVVLLSQDIIYLIPMHSKVLSMKLRKFIFIALLIIEFVFVICMRVIITNGYIPMAFIVLAYANFTVYPDPRYTWDDENVERKTIFDLFRPKIDLRAEVSYEHIGKQKGYLSDKKSRIRKVHNHKRYRPVSVVSNNSKKSNENNSIKNMDQACSSQDDNSQTYNNNNPLNNSFGNENSQEQEQVSLHSRASPSINTKQLSMEIGGLNDEIIFEDFDDESIENNNNNNDIYISIDNGRYEISRKYDAMNEFNKAINNIRNEMQYKRNTRARYNSTAIMGVIAVIVFVSVVIGIIFARTGTEEDFALDREANILGHQKPAICQWRGDDISINEFAALSCACYYSNLDDITYSWEYGRPKSSTNNFTIGENSLNSKSGVQYVDFVNKETNTIVVAVRGTSTVEDIFQDIYIWSASALLQLSGFFGTFIKFWPRGTIASLVKFIVKQFTNFQLLYWVDVEKHIMDLQQNSNATIYLTGHSLGGGVAGVISAHRNIPAITFSSPGLGFSYKTYDIELKNLINNFVNIVPMSDPVPLLDSQVGQIQTIECNTEQPLSCHSIYNTIDTLNNMCKESSVYRYWDDKAEPKINGEDIPYIMSY